MINTQSEYLIQRAIAIADICMDLACLWDFERDAQYIPDKIIMLMELIQNDLRCFLPVLRD